MKQRASLAEEVMKFSRVLENMTLDFIERGIITPRAPQPEPDPFGLLGVSLEDIVSQVQQGVERG